MVDWGKEKHLKDESQAENVQRWWLWQGSNLELCLLALTVTAALACGHDPQRVIEYGRYAYPGHIHMR
eukprot:1158274-Pelagomonas_calceolata.AAC.57